MKKFLKRSLIALVIILSMIAAVGIAVYATATNNQSEAVASTVVGTDTKYFTTLKEAMDAATGEGGNGVVNVHKNATIDSTYTLTGKTLTIQSDGDTKHVITAPATGIKMLGGATLTISNLEFTGNPVKNLITYGQGEGSGKKEYSINLENVIINFADASGAIYGYNTSDTDIVIENSIFRANNHYTQGYAILNPTLDVENCSLTLINVTKVNCRGAKDGTVTPIETIQTLANSSEAQQKGYVARLGDDRAGADGTVYFGSLYQAIEKAQSGDTIYVINNVGKLETVTLNDKDLTIIGTKTGDEKYTVTAYKTSSATAFSLKGGSALVLKNLNFDGYTGSNFMFVGQNNTADQNNEFRIDLTGVDIKHNASSGAIVLYNAKNVDIYLNSCTFTTYSTGYVVGLGGTQSEGGSAWVAKCTVNPDTKTTLASGVSQTTNTFVSPRCTWNDPVVNYLTDAEAIADNKFVRLGEGEGGYLGSKYFASVGDAVNKAGDGAKIYVIADISGCSVTIDDGRHITIIGKEKYTISSPSNPAITLTNSSGVTLQNLKFTGLTGKNLIGYKTGDITINVENVDCSFSASGAIYALSGGSTSATINIKDSTFTKDDVSVNERAVVNVAYAATNGTTITFNNVKNFGCNKVNAGSQGTVNKTIVTDGKPDYTVEQAVSNGAVAAVTNNNETLTTGKMDVVFFTSLGDAIRAANGTKTVWLLPNPNNGKAYDYGFNGEQIVLDNATLTLKGYGNRRVIFDNLLNAAPFVLKNGATLNVENIEFTILTEKTAKNLALVGQAGTANATYNISLTNVKLTFNAGGAINCYNSSVVNVTVNGCEFVANSASQGIINFGGTSPTVTGTLTCTDTKFNPGTTLGSAAVGKITVTDTFTSDQKAIECGAVAKIGTLYYRSLQAAVDAAQNNDVISVITDITSLPTTSISGKNVTIKSVGTEKLTITASTAAKAHAFLLENEAKLTLENLEFAGYVDKNLILVNQSKSGMGDYSVTLKNVDLLDYTASGAIYVYEAGTLTINVENCLFSADTYGNAVVNFASTDISIDICNMTIKDIKFNDNTKVLGVTVDTSKVTVDETFTDDVAAIAGKVMLNRDGTPVKVGTSNGGKVGVVYARTLADYFKAKGATTVIDNTYNVVYTPDAFVSGTLGTTGIKIGDNQYVQAGHDYYGAWRIAMALYGAKTDNANLPNGDIYKYGTAPAGKCVYVGLVNDKAKDLVKNIRIDEYAIYVDENGDVYLLAWNDKALNTAINEFLGMINENKATVSTGTHAFVASTKWITDFTKPAGKDIVASQYVNDDSVQYVYYGTAAEYDAYITALKAEGYAEKWTNAIEKNKFAILEKGDVVLYVAYNDFTFSSLVTANDAYRTNFQSCIRIVAMPAGSITTPDEMTAITTPNPSYTPAKIGATSFIKTVGMASPGACYIVALEDGRFIVVDGGTGYTGTALWAALVEAFEEINGRAFNAAEDKIHIAAWYLTHAHSDHYNEFSRMIKAHSADADGGNRVAGDIVLDYIIANGIDNYSISLYENSQTNWMSSDRDDIAKIISRVSNDDCKFIKAHTGQKFYFANVELEVLMTFEDHAPVAVTNSNDTNTVISMNIKTGDNVSSVLFLGDSHINAGRYLVASYGSYLKSDMVTLAHHGNVGVEALVYKLVAAKAVFVPHISTDFGDSDYRLLANKTAKDIAQYLWFAGASTAKDGVLDTDGLVTYTLNFTANGPDYANFANKAGDKATNIAAGTHASHSATVTDKGTIHYGTCDCGAIIDAFEHSSNKDDGDCTTAVTCEHCSYVFVEAKTAHEAGADDGDCTTAVKCANCDQIATPAKNAHVAGADDGDCTTAVKCANCNQIATPAKDAHVAGADDGDCTTAVKCVNCEKNAVEAKTAHVAGADDGDCTTAVKCANCNQIATPAKDAHVPESATSHKCANCDQSASSHKDENPMDGKCDICGVDNHECKDETPKDHKCDLCGETVSVCIDDDKNGKCDVCGEEVAHVCTGGTATCTQKAICSICSKEYGELGDHNYGALVPAVPEVHTQTELKAGMAAYYHCDVCDKYFNESKDESSYDALKGEVPAHKFGGWVTSNVEQHWKECSCGLKTEKGAHTYSGNHCDTCGRSLIVHVHGDVQKFKGQSATVDTAGWKEYYQCDCGNYYADAACTKEIVDLEAWKNGEGKLIPLGEVVFTPDEFADEVKDIISNITSAESPLVVVKQTTRFVTAIIGLLTKIFG